MEKVKSNLDFIKELVPEIRITYVYDQLDLDHFYKWFHPTEPFIKYQEDSLLATCRMENIQVIQCQESFEIHKITFGLILALDKNYTGRGGEEDTSPVFFAPFPDYDYIECNGSKCRQGGENGIWCLSCYAEPSEIWEHQLYGKVNLDQIIPEMILDSKIKISTEDPEGNLDVLVDALDCRRHQLDEDQQKLDQMKSQLANLPKQIDDLTEQIDHSTKYSTQLDKYIKTMEAQELQRKTEEIRKQKIEEIRLQQAEFSIQEEELKRQQAELAKQLTELES